MSIDIRKSAIRAIAQEPRDPRQPEPRLPRWVAIFAAMVVLIGAAVLGGLATLPAGETLAGRTVALQAEMMARGYDPRLVFATNTPFGLKVDTSPDPIQSALLHLFHGGLGLGPGLPMMGALGAALAGLGLFATAFRLTRGSHPLLRVGAVAVGGLGLLAAPALSPQGLSPTWGINAGAVGLAGLALGCAIQCGSATRALSGMLAGAAGSLAASALGPALLAAVVLMGARRAHHRLAGATGLGLGGGMALVMGQNMAALGLWGLAAVGLTAGLVGRRISMTVYTLLALGVSGLALLGAGQGVLGGTLDPTLLALPGLVLVAMTGYLLLARQQSWRGWVIDPPLLLALAACPLGLAGILAGHGVETAVLGLMLSARTGWGPGAMGGLGAAGLVLSTLVYDGTHEDKHRSDPSSKNSSASQSCGKMAVAKMAQALDEAGIRRVLVDPVTGWQVLMGGYNLNVVGGAIGDTEEGDGHARAALGDTTEKAEQARQITMRRSVGAIGVCGPGTTPDSIASRLWRGNKEDIGPLSDWIEPLSEGEGYALYRVHPAQ